MSQIMGIINLNSDSFFEQSRYNYSVLDSGADFVDIGAVSTRPGASDVPIEEEWSRLEPFLDLWVKRFGKNRPATLNPHVGPILSVDSFRSEIVSRVCDKVGPFVVNDISAGEDDSKMLPMVGAMELPYIAMHKKGNPRTMDSLCDESKDIILTLNEYFEAFAEKAARYGIRDWALDPGLGFSKTERQNIEILERLPELNHFGVPILIGAADKRFTHGDTEKYHLMALRGGADILRVHDVPATRKTVQAFRKSWQHSEKTGPIEPV